MKSILKANKVIFYIFIISFLCSIIFIPAQRAMSNDESVALPRPIPKVGVSLATNNPEYWTDFMPPGWSPPRIRMILRIFNDTQIPITLNFTTSQRFDFSIYDSSGAEVWRWSADRYFLQVLGQLTLNPGESKAYSYSHVFVNSSGGAMPVDTYTLKGEMVATNRVMEGKVSFEHNYVY